MGSEDAKSQKDGDGNMESPRNSACFYPISLPGT